MKTISNFFISLKEIFVIIKLNIDTLGGIQMKSYLKMIGLFILLVAVHQGLAFLYLLPVTTYYVFIGIQSPELEQLVLAQGVNATIFSGLGALLVYAFIFKNKKDNLIARSRFHSITPKQIGWSSLIGFSFVFLSLLIVQMMSKMFPFQYAKFEESMEFIVDAPLLAVFLAVAIVAPLFEEIMFRGIIYDSLQKRMNVYVSVVIAGLLFGLYHMNIFQGAYASLIGIVMGLSLIWTKSIWAPIIIHFMNNFISIVLSYTAFGAWLDLENEVPVILSLAIALTLLPFGIYKLYKTYEKPVLIEEIIDEPQIEQELDATV